MYIDCFVLGVKLSILVAPSVQVTNCAQQHITSVSSSERQKNREEKKMKNQWKLFPESLGPSVMEHNKFLGNFVADMQVDYPIHQVEANESDWKENP